MHSRYASRRRIVLGLVCLMMGTIICGLLPTGNLPAAGVPTPESAATVNVPQTFRGLLRDETSITRTFTGGRFDWRDASGAESTYPLVPLGTFDATYSFENDVVGQFPGGEFTRYLPSASCSFTVLDSYLGHNKVLEAVDNDDVTGVDQTATIIFAEPSTVGIVSFWALRVTGTSGYGFGFNILNNIGERVWVLGIHDAAYTTNFYANGAWQGLQAGVTGRWSFYSIAFDKAANVMNVSIDGIVRYSGGAGEVPTGGIGGFQVLGFGIYGGSTGTGMVDAIDYSWAPGWSAGRNAVDRGQLGTYNGTYLEQGAPFSTVGDLFVQGNSFARMYPGIGTASTGHRNVLEVYADGSGDFSTGTTVPIPQEGTISVEWWWYCITTMTNGVCFMSIMNATGGYYIGLCAANGGLYYSPGTGWTMYENYQNNVWYHFNVTYNTSSNTYSLRINGINKLENLGVTDPTTTPGKFDMGCYCGADCYFDALDVSTAGGYFPGRNTFLSLQHEFTPTSPGECAYRFSLDYAGGTIAGDWIPVTISDATPPIPPISPLVIFLIVLACVVSLAIIAGMIFWRRSKRFQMGRKEVWQATPPTFQASAGVLLTKTPQEEAEYTTLSAMRMVKLWIWNREGQEFYQKWALREDLANPNRLDRLNGELVQIISKQSPDSLKHASFLSITSMLESERLLAVLVTSRLVFIVLFSGRITHTYLKLVEKTCGDLRKLFGKRSPVSESALFTFLDARLKISLSHVYVESPAATTLILQKSAFPELVDDPNIYADARELSVPECQAVTNTMKVLSTRQATDLIIDEEEDLSNKK